MKLQAVVDAIGRKIGGGVTIYLREPEDKQYKDGCFTQTPTKSYAEVDPAIWERDPWQFISVLVHECGHAITAHHPMTSKRFELAAREYQREITNRVYKQAGGNATTALFYLADLAEQPLEVPGKSQIKAAPAARPAWQQKILEERQQWEQRMRAGGVVKSNFRTYDGLKIVY